MLEHLFKEDVHKLLKASYRSLKTGGVIRICIPDLEYIVKLYKMGSKEKALSYFFTNLKTEGLNNHRYMYDFEMLEGILKLIGFKEIEKCSYRKGRTPDIDILDNRPDETLYVEAVK